MLLRLGLPVLLAGAWCMTWNPVSPLAMGRANAAYLAGDLPRAARIYGQIATGWHLSSTRASAGERAARIALVGGEPVIAVREIHRALAVCTAADRPRLLGLLASVYLVYFDDAPRAAAALRRAADSGVGPAALDDRVAAAQTFERAEDWASAGEQWALILVAAETVDIEAMARAGQLRAERHIDDAEGE